MNVNSNDEFLNAWAMVELVVEEPVEYRIHYNEHGDITQCSMQNHPGNTDYIVVSREEYDNYFRYTVEKNKLKLIDNNPGNSVQLVKSIDGYRVVKNHAGLVLELDENYQDIEYYDTNN
jgi:hypothetical protein